MKSFYANHISCSQDDDVLSIGLADDEFDPIDFVILSRFAEPDRSADQQIGLLVNETDLEFQHAITAIRLFGSQMVIHFTDTVTEELDYDSIHIELEAPHDHLYKSLKQMLIGSSIKLSSN